MTARTAEQLLAARVASATLDAWAAHQRTAHTDDEAAMCDRCADLLAELDAFTAAARPTP